MKNENKAWVSAEDLTNDPELRTIEKQEFFELPALQDLSKDEQSDTAYHTNRRDFLKYLGFSLGAATIAAACETPVRRAIPYVVKPDAIVPGVATYYASTFLNGGDWLPILVKTREGRPIKIEGNKMSSMTKGGTSARAQAAVLDLYDVARYRNPGSVGADSAITELSWEEVDAKIASGLNAGSRIRILSNTNISPSSKAATDAFISKYPNAKLVTYDPISSSAILLANEASFGKQMLPGYDFSRARVIVSFGADFLGTWISPVEFANQFASNRKIRDVKGATMNRLVAVESMMSLTGSNADHRILIKPSEMGMAIAVLHNEVASAMGRSTVAVNGSFSNPKAEKSLKLTAKDLMEAAGKGEETLIVSGSNNTAEQVLVNHLNTMLGNYGKSIDLNNYSLQKQGIDKGVQELLNEMNSGGVDALFVVGNANPVYDLPEGDAFRQAMDKVSLKVSFSGMPNETSASCSYVCPTHHFLESWGDAQPRKNVYSLVQPTIAPLFKTRLAEVSLLKWADALPEVENGDDPYYAFVQQVWRTNVFNKQSKYTTFRAFWDSALHDGILEVSETSAAANSFNADVASLSAKISRPSSSDLEIVYYEKIGAGAGQYANNPWLQEMPDPITRAVWDNYLCVPLKWDGRKNFEYFNNLTEDGMLVNVSLNGQEISLPIVRQFGLTQNTVAVALGYGRTVSGAAGTDVGKNFFQFTSRDADGNLQYFTTELGVSKAVGKDKHFASVQHHHTMGVTGVDETINEVINVDEKAVMTLGSGYQGGLTDRTIFRSANLYNLEEKVHDLEHERAHHKKLNESSLYPGFDDVYAMGHHWGIAVDMTSCIGCSACQVACVAENNVPVVGKKEVHRHHEMTWLRIDRYYYGDAESPNVVYQPMMCQHCDNAPCENVCPVSATNHSSEGLNQMAYNRCVGTRYCANNCPYKVRRFNWLDYTTADLFPVNENNPFNEEVPFYADNLTRMVLNPDVTVRSRGVIEKCSFCVQRIQEGKLRAKAEMRQLKDGDIKSACQTACPTGAIVFGDMNDKESELSKLLDLPTNYYVLEETNVRSSVGYQMKITNKNRDIETIEA